MVPQLMRPRDLDRLANTTYDLLVIGGGIHGLAVAYDAASRGLRTALIDGADFGGAASFNHQKTVHGGLRSLQYGRLSFAHHSIRERRALARIAPWLLRPLPFIVGTYRSVTRGRLTLRAAFKLDEWLGRHRNAGVEPELHLPPPRLVSKAATLRLFPGVRQDKLTGGAQWYDYQIVEADRLTFAFGAAADRAGADLANYVEWVRPVREADRIAGAVVRDVLTGRELTLKARITVNAAGAHAGTVMAACGVKREFPLLKAMSLLTSRRASDIALAAPAASGRMLTLVPWHGRALVGTSQSTKFVQPGDTSVTAAELDQLITEVNGAFPALKVTRGDVTLVHRGVLPAVSGRGAEPGLRMTPDVHDHASEGATGLVTVVGVKYSGARGVAERTTDMVARRLGKQVRPSTTATTVLPGAGIADHEALAIETARARGLDVALPAIRHVIARYAEKGASIITLMHERPDLRGAVSSSVLTTGAEIVYVIREELAQRLTDIVIRRTGLGAAGHPGEEAIRACAAIAAAELKWDSSRVAEEIAAVGQFYAIIGI
jgi:glycerol-3-phosphate dehydrogenase